MALKPEVSLATALGVSALVISLHRSAVPPVVDLRSTTPGTPPHADASIARRQATWMSIAAVATIALLTKDVRVLIVGGATTVAYDVWERYNNQVYPSTGSLPDTGDMPTVIGKSGARTGQVVELNPYGPAQTSVM